MSKSFDFNLKNNVLNGIFLACSLSLVKPYYSKFAIRLGASDYEVALISSLPALIAVLTLIPGTLLMNRSSNKQKLTGYITLSQKLFYAAFAILPFLPISRPSLVFVCLIGLMNFPGSLAVAGYQSTIGDIFEPQERNRAMGLRNRYSDLLKLIIVFLSGQFLQYFAYDQTASIRSYQVIFFVAFLIALGEVITYFKFKGLPKVSVRPDSNLFFTILKDVPKQKGLMSFMACSLLFHFGWQMGWPLFSIYQINVLKADEGWLSMITIVASLASIFSVTLWSKFADKYSNTLTLSIATLGMSITPILYTFASSVEVLTVLNILPGICTAGTLLILFNLMLEVVPSENRIIYIAIYTTLINLSAAISPVIGIWIKEQTSIYVVLLVVGVLRMIGSIAFFIRSKRQNKSKEQF
ncbi:MAG: MFS transporter [Tissierellales bacterium]|jgi:predicted MFS family arabinose efflux permease|nr:MFS transporter [Tissierellales bacterium]